MLKEEIGKIKHYFDKIGVAVLELIKDVKLGDKLSIEGHDMVLEQNLSSMQIDRDPIETAKAGQAIGFKTKGLVHEGDIVYRIIQ